MENRSLFFSCYFKAYIFIMKFSLIIIALASLTSAAVWGSEISTDDPKSSQDTTATPKVKIVYSDERDPFEGFNRAMWNINYNYLDKFLIRPVAHGYSDYVPQPVRTSFDNFVQNLEEPSSLVNNTLQGKWKWAANAGGRFTINSTIGLLGLFDVAEMMGLSRKQDDFSEVLGYYGVPNGPYFMLPAYGPTVTREIASNWVDGLYFPISDLTTWQSITKWTLKALNARADAIPQERLLDNALDPYTFVKDAYIQHVDYKLHDGQVPDEQDDDELVDDYLNELN